jgi:hypothetical protein
VLAYLTDVEGMWNKLASFCAGSPALALDAHDRLTVAPGHTFVFGGDAVDRGPWARRLLRTLLEAKRRQPEQVILLAGNRDINKLRLPRELGGHPPTRTPAEVAAGDRPTLLRWIFQYTMGAPDAFAFRQAELAASGQPARDDDVVASFLADLEPRGLMTEYLAACQLGLREGRTLAVHGAVSESSLGLVPGRLQPTGDPRDVDVDAWVGELNAWYREQLDTFQAGGPVGGALPPWQPLIMYQAPVPGSRHNPGSVVYGRIVDDHNNLRLPDDRIIDALERVGVQRLLVGHTPSGDSPSVARLWRDDRAFELVCADNSHARHDQASRVLMDDAHLSVDAATRLDDDDELLPVRFTLAAREPSPIGQRIAADHRLIRGPLDGDRWLTFRMLANYRTEQRAARADEVDHERLEAPR